VLRAAFERLLEKSTQLASQSGDEARIDTWLGHVSSVCQSCHAE
jgi:hypothetical protein